MVETEAGTTFLKKYYILIGQVVAQNPFLTTNNNNNLILFTRNLPSANKNILLKYPIGSKNLTLPQASADLPGIRVLISESSPSNMF